MVNANAPVWNPVQSGVLLSPASPASREGVRDRGVSELQEADEYDAAMEACQDALARFASPLVAERESAELKTASRGVYLGVNEEQHLEALTQHEESIKRTLGQFSMDCTWMSNVLKRRRYREGWVILLMHLKQVTSSQINHAVHTWAQRSTASSLLGLRA